MYIDITDSVTRNRLIVCPETGAKRVEIDRMGVNVYIADSLICLYPHGSNTYEVETY